MTLPLKITLLTSLLLLAACRSEPIAFHTLTPVHWSNSSRADAGGVRGRAGRVGDLRLAIGVS